MKWNESESEVVYSDPAIQRSTCLSPMVVYSDPAIDMSQSNHLRRREGGGGVRLSKNPRGDTNRRLKPTQQY